MQNPETEALKSETAMVRAAQQGCRDSFRWLVEHHQQYIFGLIMRRLGGDHELARELSQEVFIKAYQAIDQFAYKGAFRGWLAMIALRSIANYFGSKRHKQQQRTSPYGTAAYSLESSLIAHTQSSTPVTTLELQQFLVLLRECVQNLNQNLQSVFSLIALQGESYEFVSQLVGIPVGTVRSRLNRARLDLRACLTNKGVEL